MSKPKPFDIAGGASNIITSHLKSGFGGAGSMEDPGATFGRSTMQSVSKGGEDAPNPFTLPSEDEIYKMRHRERELKETAKLQASRLKVWEKTTASSRVGRTRRIDEAEIPEAPLPPGAQRALGKGVIAAATAAISQERRSEKEDMSEFIAKKREMFLVQMSLDTKRSEIQKLESKVQMKEQALKKSEVLLEEDAIRFDAFLKENDRMAHEALKNAEREAKAKTDKLHEIKKLKHHISIMEADKSKLKESLEDCERYRRFLEALTPPEWTQEQVERKARRQEERRVTRYMTKVALWESEVKELEAEAERKEEEEKRKALKEGRMVKKKEERRRHDIRPAPTLEEEELESSGEDIPMFFARPQQLLDIFTHLEESNLFLIQNCQEIEQQLEELKQQYRDTERAISKQTSGLDDTIRTLRDQVAAEEAKVTQLRQRAKLGVSASSDLQEKLLFALADRATEVYQECGFDTGSNPTTLTMLACLEERLESLLTTLDQSDAEAVQELEKKKEKERRECVREDRIQAQKEAYALRMQISLARSQAPVQRRTGKPVMFRSAPFKVKEKKAVVDPEKEQELRDMKFFT